MKKVFITGSSGMLGTVLYDKLKNQFDCIGLDRNIPSSSDYKFIKCDLTNKKELDSVYNNILPDIVIHCAANVNIDDCERNKQQAETLHVGSTRILSELSKENGSSFIYISTDQVFDGMKKEPYIEEDLTEPLNIYSATKLQGEKVALEYDRSLVLRTNIFGWTSGKKSFAEWVLDGLINSKQLNMFTDVLFTPISTYCLSDIILACINNNISGLYHASSQTTLSKYDFAMNVAAEYNLSTDSINPVLKKTLGLSAMRPGNMALNSFKLSKELNMEMPDIFQSIHRWKANQP